MRDFGRILVFSLLLSAALIYYVDGLHGELPWASLIGRASDAEPSAGREETNAW